VAEAFFLLIILEKEMEDDEKMNLFKTQHKSTFFSSNIMFNFVLDGIWKNVHLDGLFRKAPLFSESLPSFFYIMFNLPPFQLVYIFNLLVLLSIASFFSGFAQFRSSLS